MPDTRPTLTISYSTDFSLTIRLSQVRRYDVASPEYCFDFSCRVLHSKGEFNYSGRDICFDPRTFHDFVGQLAAIRKGKAESAGFFEVGEMIKFAIGVHGRKTKASMTIREYQPNGEQTVLSAGFQVDYDMFVNALHAKATQFLRDLADVESP
jgi:hypothetical protein